MWPVLVRIPFLNADVSTYGAALALGILAGLAVWTTLVEREGLDVADAYRIGVFSVVAGIVGTKLLGLASAGLPAPGELLSLEAWRRGGIAFYGGPLAGVPVLFLLARRAGISARRALDAAAPALALGQAFGRVGCFGAGCCWGTICAYPWGVTYPLGTTERTDGPPFMLPLHPVQLYEAAFALGLAVALYRLHARRAFAGQVAIAYFVAYGCARFALELFRGDDRGDLFGVSAATGLSPSQLVSIALAAGALAAGARWRTARASLPGDADASRPLAERPTG
jgi:phosphatidylglycerol:prolipoprotein diacylglycerol transferase